MERENNKKKQTWRVIALCASLLIITLACSKFPGGSGRSAPDDFRTGTKGITVAFQQSFGKEIIVSGDIPEPISFLLLLKNEGSYPESEGAQGVVWLSGFDQSIITLREFGTASFGNDPSAELSLVGRSPANPIGGSGLREFPGTITADPKILKEGKYKATVLANVCYLYHTIANPAVCIELNPFQFSNEKKVCTARDITLSGQGAPVAVTKIEQITSADKIRFRIMVKNAGKGTVADPYDQDGLSCDRNSITAAKRHQLDIVYVEKIAIGERLLDCGNSLQNGKFHLIDGVGSFTCGMPKDELETKAQAFTTPLDITLSYLYKDTAETPLVINKID